MIGPFVGRDREIARLSAAIEAGENVILSGKLGIGKTTLLEEFRARCGGSVAIADLGSGPASACRGLAGELLGRKGRSSKAGGYLANRAALAGFAPRGRGLVVALDNADLGTRGRGTVSLARLDLVRHLAGNRAMRLIVVCEMEGKGRNFNRLRAWLHPVRELPLERLPLASAREYFDLVRESLGLAWPTDRLEVLARASQGYPLAMRRLAEREIEGAR